MEDLESEAEWIQAALADILNENVRAITICARSKRWCVCVCIIYL